MPRLKKARYGHSCAFLNDKVIVGGGRNDAIANMFDLILTPPMQLPANSNCVCLFVCNRGDTILYHGGLRSRELG